LKRFPKKAVYVAENLSYCNGYSICLYSGDQRLEAKARDQSGFEGIFSGRRNFYGYRLFRFSFGQVAGLFGDRPVRIFHMMRSNMEFSPFMFLVLGFSFLAISFCMGMLIHSSLMYEDKNGIKKDSKLGWILSMAAGAGITGWMFYYGYYVNFGRA